MNCAADRLTARLDVSAAQPTASLAGADATPSRPKRPDQAGFLGDRNETPSAPSRRATDGGQRTRGLAADDPAAGDVEPRADTNSSKLIPGQRVRAAPAPAGFG